jgi:hypothetical protein
MFVTPSRLSSHPALKSWALPSGSFAGTSRSRPVRPDSQYLSITLRIDDEATTGVQKSRVWEARRTAELSQQGISSRILQGFVLFVFLNHQFHRHKVLLEDGLDVRLLQERIQLPAPTAPGRAEMKKYRFILSQCFRLR